MRANVKLCRFCPAWDRNTSLMSVVHTFWITESLKNGISRKLFEMRKKELKNRSRIFCFQKTKSSLFLDSLLNSEFAVIGGPDNSKFSTYDPDVHFLMFLHTQILEGSGFAGMTQWKNIAGAIQNTSSVWLFSFSENLCCVQKKQKRQKNTKEYPLIRPPLWPLSYTSRIMLEMGFEPTTKGLLWGVLVRRVNFLYIKL